MYVCTQYVCTQYGCMNSVWMMGMEWDEDGMGMTQKVMLHIVFD